MSLLTKLAKVAAVVALVVGGACSKSNDAKPEKTSPAKASSAADATAPAFEGPLPMPPCTRANDKVTRLATCDAQCAKDDAEACDVGANMLRTGVRAKQDQKKAFAMYEKACTLGFGEACASIWEAYNGSRGLGTRWTDVVADKAKADDYKAKAIKAYERECNAGVGDSCDNLSTFDAAHKDELQARAGKAWLTGCDAGRAADCARAALSYDVGMTLPKDKAKARELYAKACALGHAVSCEEAGDRKRGCELGDGSACFVLASDYDMNVDLMMRACSLGSSTGCAFVIGRFGATPDARLDQARESCCAFGDDDCCKERR